MNCAPGNKGCDNSCYSKDQLVKIASALNKSRKLSIITKNKTKKEIWEQIQKG